MKSPLTINAEYFLLRFFCGVVNLVPYPVAMAMARGLGWFAVVVCGFKRRRTLEGIASVFPDMPIAERKRVALQSLQNVLQSAVEMIRAPKLTREWMDRHVVDGAHYKDLLQELVDEGKGVVIMVPHSGNWYMAAWSMAKYGLPLCALAARQRNPKIDAWMNRQYGDIEVLDRDNRETLSRIRDYLRGGRAFAILPDLRVRKPDVSADFFGGKANVSHAGAMYAVHAGCPIAVAVMRRENGRHVFDYLKLLRPDPNAANKKAEAVRLTQEAMKLLSASVMKHPEHWFWYNKRWILEPV